MSWLGPLRHEPLNLAQHCFLNLAGKEQHLILGIFKQRRFQDLGLIFVFRGIGVHMQKGYGYRGRIYWGHGGFAYGMYGLLSMLTQSPDHPSRFNHKAYSWRGDYGKWMRNHFGRGNYGICYYRNYVGSKFHFPNSHEPNQTNMEN